MSLEEPYWPKKSKISIDLSVAHHTIIKVTTQPLPATVGCSPSPPNGSGMVNVPRSFGISLFVTLY